MAKIGEVTEKIYKELVAEWKAEGKTTEEIEEILRKIGM